MIELKTVVSFCMYLLYVSRDYPCYRFQKHSLVMVSIYVSSFVYLRPAVWSARLGNQNLHGFARTCMVHAQVHVPICNHQQVFRRFGAPSSEDRVSIHHFVPGL